MQSFVTHMLQKCTMILRSVQPSTESVITKQYQAWPWEMARSDRIWHTGRLFFSNPRLCHSCLLSQLIVYTQV
ncbi:hypothetical protein D6D22_05921 [Aureobasidium pullulans]|uniref:Uncharacterized protein n=1 Tax=Aureobasidium pullulans TaxID=5580 RepID=A0A4S8XQS8_AURPU|nr:hypothetical protein D6D22_05921 [Aureobasidium pullulans]